MSGVETQTTRVPALKWVAHLAAIVRLREAEEVLGEIRRQLDRMGQAQGYALMESFVADQQASVAALMVPGASHVEEQDWHALAMVIGDFWCGEADIDARDRHRFARYVGARAAVHATATALRVQAMYSGSAVMWPQRLDGELWRERRDWENRLRGWGKLADHIPLWVSERGDETVICVSAEMPRNSEGARWKLVSRGGLEASR